MDSTARKRKSLVRLASLLIQIEAAQLTSAGHIDSGLRARQLVQLEQARRRAEALVLHREIHGPVIPRLRHSREMTLPCSRNLTQQPAFGGG
jgi:hypothetical protein